MAGQFSTGVTRKDIKFLSKKRVAIKSTGLLNTFVHSAPHAIEKLQKHVGSISMDDVSIDDSGRIVIDNPTFVAALKRNLAATAADSNTVCKNAYRCGEK
jgi:hypothetical protein